MRPHAGSVRLCRVYGIISESHGMILLDMQLSSDTHSPWRLNMPADPQAGTKDCRAEFAVPAARYRRTSRYFTALGVAALLFFALGLLKAYRLVGSLGCGACGIVCLFGSFFPEKLACPNCRHSVEHEVEFFCPLCGSDALDRNFEDLSCTPRCYACKSALGRYKGRRLYKVRFCTVCGAHLDDEGV